MNTARKLLRKLIKEEMRSMNEDSNGSVKDFIDDALKKAGIKVTKYLPMKSGWLRGKFWWGGFYTVQANKRKDILPFTVDKKGNVHLNVSPEKWIVGKIDQMSKVVQALKDFKKSDLDVFESVNKTKRTVIREFFKQEIKKSLNEASLPKLETPSDVSYYNRDWGEVFNAWGNRRNIDFGPRESDMYDWHDRSLYDKVVKEFHAHMNWVAKDLNTASRNLEGSYKAWNKILDKYRRKDRS